jgi:hypothetical protein
LPRIASLRSWLTASDTPDHVATTLFVHGRRECFGLGASRPPQEAGLAGPGRSCMTA